MFYKEFYKRELEFKTTNNRRVYNISRKHYLAVTGKIKCAICPYNHYENSVKKNDLKCWKRYRNTQYKTVGKF